MIPTRIFFQIHYSRRSTQFVQSPGAEPIGHFRVPKKSHFQNEAKCEAIEMKMIFNYYANKTHFHNKGFALSLVLKVRFFGTRKWPIFRAVFDSRSSFFFPERPEPHRNACYAATFRDYFLLLLQVICDVTAGAWGKKLF